MDKCETEKILKKLLFQGFNIIKLLKYLKEKHNIYDFN